MWIILGIILLIWILLRCSVTVYFAIEKSEQEIISPAKRADKVKQIEMGSGFIELAVKWLCFTFYPAADKPKKEKKKKRKKPKRSKKHVNKHEKSSVDKHQTNISEEISEDIHVNENDSDVSDEKGDVSSNEPLHQEDNDSKQNEKSVSEKGKKKSKKNKKSKNDDGEPKPSLKEKLANLKRKWLKIKPYIPLAKKSFVRLLKLIRFYDFELYLNSADKDAYEAAMKFGKMNAAVYNGLAVFMQLFDVYIKHTQITCKFNSDKTDFAVKCYVKVRPSTLLRIVFSAAFSALFVYLRERKRAKIENSKGKNEDSNENNETEM